MTETGLMWSRISPCRWDGGNCWPFWEGMERGKPRCCTCWPGSGPPEGEAAEAGAGGDAAPEPPDPLFGRKTLREDLLDQTARMDLPPAEGRGGGGDRGTVRPGGAAGPSSLRSVWGEQQRAALAKVLLTRPEVLLLDEPTKGLDWRWQEELAALLQRLLSQGAAVILVSHDLEFCARYAHRCALFFDGAVVAQDQPRAFFPGTGSIPPPPTGWSGHTCPRGSRRRRSSPPAAGNPVGRGNRWPALLRTRRRRKRQGNQGSLPPYRPRPGTERPA